MSKLTHQASVCVCVRKIGSILHEILFLLTCSHANEVYHQVITLTYLSQATLIFMLDWHLRTYASSAAHSDSTIARILVGNKCDLENIREVPVEEGKELAEEQGLFFMETSALDSTNVKTAFEIVTKEIYANVSRKVLNSDSHKAELSQNRVSLTTNGEAKQTSTRFSCC